jgi:hypothetical protein
MGVSRGQGEAAATAVVMAAASGQARHGQPSWLACVQKTLPSHKRNMARGRLQKHPLDRHHFPQQPDERNPR